MDLVAVAEDPLVDRPVVARRPAQVGRRRDGLEPTELPVAPIEVSVRVLAHLEVAGRGRQVPGDALLGCRVVGAKVHLERGNVVDLDRVGQVMTLRVDPPISGPLAVMGDEMRPPVVNGDQMAPVGLVWGAHRAARVAKAMMIVAIDQEMAHRRHAKSARRANRGLRLSDVQRKYAPEVAVGRDSIKKRRYPTEPLNVGSTKARCGLRPRQPCNEHSRSVVTQN